MTDPECSGSNQQLAKSPSWRVETILDTALTSNMLTITEKEDLSSYAPVSRTNPGLGTFSRLPREIRDLIWREFLPKNHNKISAIQLTDSQDTQLAVLRTSRHIYHEVGIEIYPSGLNPFIISVTPEYKYESWVTLSNGKKNPTIWELRSSRDAVMRGFSEMCPQRTAFRIEIEAPDLEDGGQVICLFRKVQDLVTLLDRIRKCVRGVEIIFKDGKKGKWFIDGKATTTNLNGKECSYLCMLLPFLKLRSLNHSKVEVPEGVNLNAYGLKIIRKIERIMKKATPFGEYGSSNNDWSDASTLSNIMRHKSRCARAIHTLKGWTAMMFRLEEAMKRYSELSVCEETPEKMKRVFKQIIATGNQDCPLWTIRDDAMIKDGSIRIGFYGRFALRIMEIEREDKSLRYRAGLLPQCISYRMGHDRLPSIADATASVTYLGTATENAFKE